MEIKATLKRGAEIVRHDWNRMIDLFSKESCIVSYRKTGQQFIKEENAQKYSQKDLEEYYKSRIELSRKIKLYN